MIVEASEEECKNAFSPFRAFRDARPLPKPLPSRGRGAAPLRVGEGPGEGSPKPKAPEGSLPQGLADSVRSFTEYDGEL
jgi:hypothetical protein